MKVEDIQIGDWVQNPLGVPYQVLAIHFYKINGDGDGYYGVHLKNKGAEARLEIYDLHPVPITSEILEKNGFVKGRRKEGLATEYSWVEDIYIYPQTIVIYTIYDRPIGGINSLLRCVSPSKAGSGQNDVHICEVGSIHQLQHALHILGIKKEIVL